MRGLKEKRVLITGGASGIGAATVKRFLEEGARVLILDINADGCRQMQQRHPDLAGVLVADVADAQQVAQSFANLKDCCGGVDIVINNAGISIRHPFTEIAVKDWQRVINVNLNGVFYVAQQAAGMMLAGNGGVIINMGSTNGIMGYPLYADYNASKAAVIELSRSLAVELAPTIRVMAVCPGYVMTPMQLAEYTPEMIDQVNAKIPLRRHATPEEIAALFAFLASDEAPYINGHPIIIDGGEVAGGLASR